MDEREIIERVRAGDNDAFGALVDRYQSRVYSLALRMCGNEDDALDLSQEAFLRAWRNLPNFQFESAFSTWLFRLTHNICIDFLRSRKRKAAVSLTVSQDGEEEAQFDLPDPAPDPEQALLMAEDRALVAKALAALPAEQREIIVLRAVNGLSYGEIAAILKLQEGTVKSRLSRARAALRNKFLQFGNNFEPAASNLSETIPRGKEDAQ